MADEPSERPDPSSADRAHFRSRYAGEPWEDYAPAYDYGRELARKRPGRAWADVEADARDDWDDFDRFADAIRHGFERMLGDEDETSPMRQP